MAEVQGQHPSHQSQGISILLCVCAGSSTCPERQGASCLGPLQTYRIGVTDIGAWVGAGRWARDPAFVTLSHYLTTLLREGTFFLMVQQP